MSSHLLPEILDLVVDHLHADPETLRTCCLVSKAWIPRTRQYFFNLVKIRSRSVREWRENFPDPLNSPARHVRSLSVDLTNPISDADVNTLLTFRNVSRLDVGTTDRDDQTLSLVPLHGFCPALESLRLSFSSLPSSEIFDFTCSFPILQDLMFARCPTLILDSGTSILDSGTWNTPSTSPRLTGSLTLRLMGRIRHFTFRLLDLPNGVHFRRIVVEWMVPEDAESTMDLVSRCSDTLESLEISGSVIQAISMTTIDLSNTPKLKDINFTFRNPDVNWATQALQTADINNLQSVSLTTNFYVISRAGKSGTVDLGWENLDRLLVQFWTSTSLRPKLTCRASLFDLANPRDIFARLLPESMGRGIVDGDFDFGLS